MTPGPRLPSEFPTEGPDGGQFPSVCPGYSTILPAVIETGRALTWRKEGNLSEFYDGAPVNETAKIYIDMLASEISTVERHAVRFGMSQAKKQAKQGGHDGR